MVLDMKENRHEKIQLEEFKTFCLRILERPHGLTVQQISSLYSYLGELYFQLGEDQRAEEAIGKSKSLIEARDDIPQDVISTYQRGRLLEQDGNLEMAKKCFQKVLDDETSPKRLLAGAYHHLFTILKQEGKNRQDGEAQLKSLSLIEQKELRI